MTTTSEQPATPEALPALPTPGHTIGPFFHDAFDWVSRSVPSDRMSPGDLAIEVRILDGEDAPIPAWLIEAWTPQSIEADTAAGVAVPGLRRLTNRAEGSFVLHASNPAPGQPAAFITLFGLGLTRHQYTAVFLPDVMSDLEQSFLSSVPEDRRGTLLATRIGPGRYEWTIRTQGAQETVFLDYE